MISLNLYPLIKSFYKFFNKRAIFRIIYNIFFLLLLFFVSFFLVKFVSSVVPYDMDEFIEHHQLACFLQPLSFYHDYREACSGAYDLKINFLPSLGWIPLRSFVYVGSIPGLFYYPVHLIVNDLSSDRFHNAIFIIIQAIIIARLFKIHFVITFAFLVIFFQYFIGHIIDFGPVVHQTTSIFLIAILSRRIGYYLSRRYLFNSICVSLFIGFLMFVMFWIKPAALFIIPGLIIFICLYITIGYDTRTINRVFFERVLLSLTFITLSFGVFLFIFYFAHNQNEVNPYFELINNSKKISFLNLPDIWESFKNRFSIMFVNPLMPLHHVMIFSKTTRWQGFFNLSLIITLLVLSVFYLKSNIKSLAILVLGLVCFLMTLFFISASLSSWGWHHLILAFPFFLFSYFTAIKLAFKNKSLQILLFLFIISNMYSYYEFSELRTPRGDLNHNIDKVVKEIDKYANSHIIVIADWGIYYIQHLFGKPTQLLLYIEPLNSLNQINKLKILSKKLSRKILFVFKEHSLSNKKLVKNEFQQLEKLSFDFNAKPWEVFKQ